MAVIISNGATNLSTANSFYRVESHNLSLWSTTYLDVATARQIPVTFANAGNCKGLIIALSANGAGNTRDVTVDLQENTGSWVTRVSKTLTANDIKGGSVNSDYATWVRQFEFSVPYAVTTAANTWRFNISQTTGGPNTWRLSTSNGTAPFYATWCDNQLSFTNNDCVIAKDKITIDQTCTFKGVLGTGDAVWSTCAVACASSTPSIGNEAMFEWQNPAAASYTMTLDGLMLLSANAGFRAGTQANPIAAANQAKISVVTATSGTNIWSGFSSTGYHLHAAYCGRSSLIMYGEIPANRITTLSADAAFNQKNIVTTATTGWSVGDRVVVSKAQQAAGTTDSTPYLISSISGNNITLNNNLTTAKRLAGAHVWNVDNYGIDFNSTATSINMYNTGSNGVFFSGVHAYQVVINVHNGTSNWKDDQANIYHNYGYSYSAQSMANFGSIGGPAGSVFGIDNTHVFRAGFSSSAYQTGAQYKITNNVIYNTDYLSTNAWSSAVVEDNYFYNAPSCFITLGGMIGGSLKRNNFYGTNYAIRNNAAFINVDWSNNKFNRVNIAIYNFNVMVNTTMNNDEYGVDEFCTSIVTSFASYNPYHDILINNPKIGTVTNLNQNVATSVDGTKARFQNYNQVADTDMTITPYGDIYRTKSTLADTTVRTAGGSAMRFTPYSGTNKMHWEQIIPTGDIKDKTMTITCWVKINNVAYYAGTHTKPTLTIDYDNGTLVSSVATTGTGWQQLAVTFTPTTSYGQIEMKVSGATDATTTDRYFYVDDVNIAYPAGVAINLGALDLWAGGLPVAPAIATMPSISGIWDELASSHTIPGSMGRLQVDGADNAELAAIK